MRSWARRIGNLLVTVGSLAVGAVTLWILYLLVEAIGPLPPAL